MSHWFVTEVQPSLYIKASLRPGVRDLMSNWAAIELLNESAPFTSAIGTLNHFSRQGRL